jgi:hypothetical protein
MRLPKPTPAGGLRNQIMTEIEHLPANVPDIWQRMMVFGDCYLSTPRT